MEEKRVAKSEGDDGSGVCFCSTGSLDEAQRRSEAVNPAADGLKHLKLVQELRHVGLWGTRLHLISFQLRLVNGSIGLKQ